MTYLKVICSIVIACNMLISKSALNEWYKFENESCSVLFPSAPKSDTLAQGVGDERIVFYIHSLKTGPSLKDSNYAYELLYNATPDKALTGGKQDIAESFFQGTISSTVQDLKGKILMEKDIMLNGYYGKDVTVLFANQTKVARLKCFVVKGTGYTLEVYSPAGNQPNVNATTFFDSFKIK